MATIEAQLLADTQIQFASGKAVTDGMTDETPMNIQLAAALTVLTSLKLDYKRVSALTGLDLEDPRPALVEQFINDFGTMNVDEVTAYLVKIRLASSASIQIQKIAELDDQKQIAVDILRLATA